MLLFRIHHLDDQAPVIPTTLVVPCSQDVHIKLPKVSMTCILFMRATMDLLIVLQ